MQQIEDELKNLSLPQEIMGYLKTDMERIINKQNEAHNREVKAVRKQYDDCQDKIKRLRSLLLEGHITPEEYRDMNEYLKKEQYELEGKSELLTKADEKFSIAISTILSLGNNAYQIFQSSKVETKREILHLLLSNLKLQDRRISYNLRKPFDLINSLNEKTPRKSRVLRLVIPTRLACSLCSLRRCVLARLKPHRHTPVCLSSLSNSFLRVRIKLKLPLKKLSIKESFFNGDPNEIRTRVAALRGPRPRPLDDGTVD